MATIAEDALIGPFCSIGENVVIKSGVVIAAHVIIEGNVTLEENVKVFSYAKLGNPEANVTVGAGSHIREFAQIATDGSAEVSIGKEVFLMGYTQIASGVTIGDNAILTNAVNLATGVECEERVIIGGMSSVGENCKIGTGVMIGGASHLKESIPPFSIVEGNPARVRGLNLIGIRRRFNDAATTSAIKNVYKATYKDGINKEIASDIIAQNANEQAVRFSQFILDNF